MRGHSRLEVCALSHSMCFQKINVQIDLIAYSYGVMDASSMWHGNLENGIISTYTIE